MRSPLTESLTISMASVGVGGAGWQEQRGGGVFEEVRVLKTMYHSLVLSQKIMLMNTD